MTRPQGYRQAAAEECFFLLVLCLPYYQSLLVACLSGTLSALLLTCLMAFVVANAPQVADSLVTLFKTLSGASIALVADRRSRWVSVPMFAVVDGPSLAPFFQRPPPLFS